jgi:hypothetical protein
MKNFLLIIAVLAIGFIFHRYESERNVASPHFSPSALAMVASSSSKRKAVVINSLSSASSSSAANEVKLDAAAGEVIDRWKFDKGYMPNDAYKIDEYSRFDVKTLKIMSDNGDIIAQTELISRFTAEEDRKREINKALAMGSTAAIIHRGVLYDNEYKLAKSDELRHEALLNRLALYEFGVLRGDRYHQIDAEYSLLRNIQLSEADRRIISERGKALYEQLQLQRIELGMGDFDNSVPPEVKKFHDDLAETYGVKKGGTYQHK